MSNDSRKTEEKATTARWRLSESKTRAGWHVLIGPYDEGFLEDMKRAVHVCEREWLPVSKVWRVRSSEIEAVKAVIRDHSPPEHVEATADDLLALAPTLGDDVTNTEAGAVVLEGVALGVDAAGLGSSGTAARVVAIGKGTKRQLLIVVIAELRADS